MCGIFYVIYNKISIEKIRNNIDNIIEKIKYRGPDLTNIVEEENFYLLHTLLAIQGFNPQPVKGNNSYLLFNGEIYSTSSLKDTIDKGMVYYNPIPNNFKNEGDFLLDYFQNYGFEKLDELDGEFVINYIDKKNKKIHIITDPFGTKPFCVLHNNEIFIASSYESCIKNSMKELNIEGKISFVKPNTHYIYNMETFDLISQKQIVQWDFNPRFSNFDRWNFAFNNSIKKRTNTDKGIFVPLSSGYDSGCIVSALIKNNKKFETYTFKGEEDINTLENREKKIHDSGNNFYYVNPKNNINIEYENYCKRIENYTAYHINGLPYADIYDAWSCFGIYQIFQKARQDNQIIFLSGHGGDEIFSDYGNEGNKSASILELDYTEVRSKWPNFDSSYGRNIIQMFERVGGCFGIESRYPFLDKQVVQEFLWLSDSLKNSEFKQCLSQYMRKDNFPFLENNKCPVRVLTEEDGGNTFFLNNAENIRNKLKIYRKDYPNFNINEIDKNVYRPSKNFTPTIEYYP